MLTHLVCLVFSKLRAKLGMKPLDVGLPGIGGEEGEEGLEEGQFSVPYYLVTFQTEC